MSKQKLKKYSQEEMKQMIGKEDQSQFKRKFCHDGIWRITKHSESYLNCIALAEKYTNKKQTQTV